jgi:ATP-binding cassette subfamily B protein
MMLRLSPFLTLLSLLVIPLGIAITSGIAKKTRTYFSGQAKELGAMNGFIEETVSGERTVKAFRMEKRVIADFDEVNGRLTREGVRAQVFSGIIPPFMNLINNLSFVIVACAGGYLAVRGIITVGLIASFLSYSKQFGRPINEMANQFNMIQSAIACAERVFEVMDAAPEPADMQGSAVLSGVRGEVELSGVQFSYRPGVPVLKDISLKAEPGKSIAIVGPTGAGKTTIVNLLCRFYEIDKGSILVDGRNIASVTRESLRRSFGIVLQDTYLFSGTVRENIRYGRLDASDAEVEEAARIAEADVFIRRLPSGYETVLSDDAGNLSLGQRQLVTIARAILADPPILILDEATSNVDTRTELHIQKAMLSLMRGRTSFVIAHRLSTIRDAAEIIVIDQGTIIERGNHEKLMNEQGFYYKLYSSQWKREAEMRESVRLV